MPDAEAFTALGRSNSDFALLIRRGPSVTVAGPHPPATLDFEATYRGINDLHVIELT